MARKKQTLLDSAMVLVASMIIVKIIGVIYKIPITNDIGLEGIGYYDVAYNFYIPIYSISLAGLPVAVSKMVSHYAALERYRDVRRVKKVANWLFVISGILGTLLLMAIAYPFTSMDWALSINNPQVFPSLMVIAPSILFCCLISSYRGYYNGLRNMYPSAISEIVEAVVKAVFGIIFVKIILKKGFADFAAGLPVFGKTVIEEKDALTVIYSYAAAGAILGVTLGTVFAWLFMVLRHRLVGDQITSRELRASPPPEPPNEIAKKIMVIALPIVTSSLIFELTNFIDAWSIQNRLGVVVENNMEFIQEMFAESFRIHPEPITDVRSYIYGAYSISLTFKNLLPTLTVTLGTSIVPILSEAWTLGDKKGIKRSIESLMRVTMLIALPAGIGMGVMAEQIITLLYNQPKVLSGLAISAPCLAAYGYSAFLIASAQPLTSTLQGLGRSDIPLVSTTVGAVLKIIINFALISIPSINIYGAVAGSIVCYAAIVLINYISIIRVTKVRPNLMAIFVKPLFCSVLCGVAAWASYGLLEKVIPAGNTASRLNGNTLCTLLAILIAVVVYAVALLYSRTITKSDVRMLPKGEKISKTLEKYGFLG